MSQQICHKYSINLLLILSLLNNHVLSVPVPPQDTLYSQFMNYVINHSCVFPKGINFPAEDCASWECLSLPLKQCDTPEATNSKEISLLCNEIFENLVFITCHVNNTIEFSGASIALSAEVCKDFKLKASTIPQIKDYLGPRLTDEVVCNIICLDNLTLLCKTLLWSYDVRNIITAALEKIKLPTDKGVSSKEVNGDTPNAGTKIQVDLINQGQQTKDLTDLQDNHLRNNQDGISHDHHVTENELSKGLNEKKSEAEKSDDAENIHAKLQPEGDEETNMNQVINIPSKQKTDTEGDEINKNIVKGKTSSDSMKADQTDVGAQTKDSNGPHTKINPDIQLENEIPSEAIEHQPDQVPENEPEGKSQMKSKENHDKSIQSLNETATELSKSAADKSVTAVQFTNTSTVQNNLTKNVDLNGNVVVSVPESGKSINTSTEEKKDTNSNLVPKEKNASSSKVASSTIEPTLEKMEDENLPQQTIKDQDYSDLENEDQGEYPKTDYDGAALHPSKDKDSDSTVPKVVDVANENLKEKTENSKSFDEFLPKSSYGRGSDDIQVIPSFPEQEDGHFFFYFLSIVLILMAGYLIFHNKQKIIALIVEGRHERRRRSHGVSYKKLETK